MPDELVKSRHSGLSGIMSPHIAFKRYDSGQAGMTSKEGFSTFHAYNPITKRGERTWTESVFLSLDI
jgi:hypothetical protein